MLSLVAENVFIGAAAGVGWRGVVGVEVDPGRERESSKAFSHNVNPKSYRTHTEVIPKGLPSSINPGIT
jgi:hypothetical protein